MLIIVWILWAYLLLTVPRQELQYHVLCPIVTMIYTLMYSSPYIVLQTMAWIASEMYRIQYIADPRPNQHYGQIAMMIMSKCFWLMALVDTGSGTGTSVAKAVVGSILVLTAYSIERQSHDMLTWMYLLIGISLSGVIALTTTGGWIPDGGDGLLCRLVYLRCLVDLQYIRFPETRLFAVLSMTLLIATISIDNAIV